MDHPHVEPLSRFLHSPSWEAHLVHEYPLVHRDDQTDALFTQISLPLNGSFWRGSRVPVPEKWSLPDFPDAPWFIRIQPDTLAAECNLRSAFPGKVRTQKRSIQPPQTAVLDLSKSNEDLLAAMHQKHRYNIKVAQRAGIRVRIAQDNFVEEFATLWKLIEKTSDRHDIRSFGRAHYESIVQSLQHSHTAYLAFAEAEDGTPLAGALLVSCDQVVTYLHGGSDYAHRSLMAPYLLHWEIMQWAKHASFTTYDLWGVNTRNGKPIPNHPSYGTSRFKLGFGGSLMHYPRTYDIVLNPFWYSLYKLGQYIRRTPPSFNDTY